MTLDVAFMVNFAKENWDELALLVFTFVMFIISFAGLFNRNFFGFLEMISVYFPALVFLVAKLFYNTSWMLLTGYVAGSSLALSISFFAVKDDNDKTTAKIKANGIFTAVICLSLIFG